MCQTFSDSLIGGENSYNMFLKQDPNKAAVFNNFKNLNRDLTKAFLRQAETKKLYSHAKGGALPENHIKQKKQDDDTFDRVSSLFDSVLKRSRHSTRFSTNMSDQQAL